jgi:GntR family transcriptional regulator/MocR family aminotransferase
VAYEIELTIRRDGSEDSGQDAYRQVYHQLRAAILAGALPPGARLPSSRALARQTGVARVTIVQAYDMLKAEGYTESRGGAGTFVSARLAGPTTGPAPFRPPLTEWGRRALDLGRESERVASETPATRAEIDFGFGRSFAELFPYDIWRRLLGRYLSTDDAMLSRYGSAAGFGPLRAAVADYLIRARGVRCRPDQVVIVSGAQQALDILARLLLAPGDEVVVETPGYRDAFTLFRLHRARLIGLPVDAEGLPVDRIPADCRARLAFVTPSHQFPKGGTMPLARRQALLAWARERDAVVVEDDYDGDLRYEGRSLAALQGLDEDGRVVYLGTFSKVLFPALRLGYLVLPPALVTPFTRAKDLVDRGAPTLTQAAVADFIGEGHFERHLRHLRHLYGQRRAALVSALAEQLGGRVRFSPVAAGLHVMVFARPHAFAEPDVDEARLVREAAARGARVYAGAPYHLEQPAPPSILLGFSGLNETDIVEGVRRLAAAWLAVARDGG